MNPYPPGCGPHCCDPPTQFVCGDDDDEWCACAGTDEECGCVQREHDLADEISFSTNADGCVHCCVPMHRIYLHSGERVPYSMEDFAS